jgi:NAD+ kinase
MISISHTLPMPIYLILVRHGESEGNLAHDAEKNHQQDLYTEKFTGKPGHLWRLTERGVCQAHIAGQWLRENFDVESIKGFFTSDYARAKETAAHLNLPGARWKKHPYLHERSWGLLETLTEVEKWKKYEEDMKQREFNPFYWRPPRGETMVNVMLRVDSVFGTLHREYSDSSVIMVDHGDVIMAKIILLEKINVVRYEEIRRIGKTLDKIHNCQVIIYSRKNPRTGKIGPYLDWKLSVCPWNLKLSRNKWQKIKRPVFSNEDLLAEVELTPRIIHNPCCEIMET